MKVTRAEYAGACYGVSRALDIARELANSSGKVQTLGPLIHNPSVVANLESQGVAVAESVADIDADTVIIRSHGVVPEVEEELKERGLDIADATCPHVARAQNGAADLAKEGCQVIVVGESGHPEVESLVAYARKNGARADVVLSPDDLPESIDDPVGVVVQTTQIRDTLNAIVDSLELRGYEPRVKDTICSATQKRQKAAAELAQRSDVMIVIGGRNSSNTTRLAEICSRICPRTYHIESASEVANLDLSDAEHVGISAGASTPEEQIYAVESAIEALARDSRSETEES